MSESMQWAIDLKKKMGEKFIFCGIPGWGRLVSISEFESAEEYAQSLQSPIAIAGFLTYESYPLVEYSEQGLVALLEAVKSAM